MQRTLLQIHHRILQLPNPGPHPILDLLPIHPLQSPPIHLLQRIQLLARRRPIIRRINRVLLRLLARNLEFVARRGVLLLDVLEDRVGAGFARVCAPGEVLGWEG